MVTDVCLLIVSMLFLCRRVWMLSEAKDNHWLHLRAPVRLNSKYVLEERAGEEKKTLF